MIVPTTSVSALLLLVLSFVCLGSWPNMFKLTGTRWRFELFYFDFAVGAVLLSAIAAFTLGTLGSELAFTDRMLVAGRAAQAFAFASGFIFNLGNMLLVAAVALIGMSGAFSLSIGVALVVGSFFNFKANNIIFLVSGIALAILALILDTAACRIRDHASSKNVPVSKSNPPPNIQARGRTRKTAKGLAVGIIGGILLGLFYPVAAKGMPGEFGIGPYAGVLLFSLGILISTLIFDFYFLNIAIEGGPLAFSAYFRGNARQHFLGFAGGALWAAGALAAALVRFAPAEVGLDPVLSTILPLASVLLVLFWGAAAWKEFARAPSNAKVSLAFTAILLAGAIVVFGIGGAR